MRAGACTVQQALTPDATAVVKQAVSLARRRGNPQVTPLHVASAMLLQQQGSGSPSSGLLRAACLRSHSHPLQCKALELCFNVALNRLPASTSPLLGHGHVYYPPSLSNALVAAFKRAQAHQRRGSSADAQQQQQPVQIAVKIELEQLVISILDDPSVSRVMREAGFSSTQIKANVEQAVSSVEGNSPPACTSAAPATPQSPNPSGASHKTEETKPSKLLVPPLHDQVRDEEDVRAILDCMASRSKRRFMVIAECEATAEAVARAAIEKIKRGEAPRLRGVQVISLRVYRFCDMPRDDVERMLAELRRAVKAAGGRGAGVVVFVEDLAWAAEYFSSGRAAEAAERRRWWPAPSSSCRGYYSAVEHAVAEVRALVCHDGDGVWLVGHGTYQSYMRCRAGRPSLEMLWELQTLAVPAGSLALSLNCVDDSAMVINHQMISEAKCDDRSRNASSSRCLSLLEASSSGQLTAASTFCGECSATKCEAVKPLPRFFPPSSSSIPHWLQRCHDLELAHSKKWSLTCGGSPSQRTTLNLSTVVSPSSSGSSYEKKHYHLHHPYQPWLHADVYDANKHQAWKANSGGQVHVVEDEDVELVGAINVKSNDSGASNSSAEEVQCRSRFKELSAENLKALCSALEKEVPWRADMVPEIASTVLRCRSGMARRRRDDADASRSPASAKEDTWLFFLGRDTEGKARVVRELARLVFGSRKCFVSIGAAASSPARSDSTEQHQQGSKRPRSASCLDRLYETVRDNPHRVIMVDDVEQADRRCQSGIMEAIESGLVRSHGGDEAALGDAIVVLSCESLDTRSRTSSPPVTKKAKKLESDKETKEDEGTGDDHRHKESVAAATSASAFSFDLNMSVENDDVEDICFTYAGLLKAVDRAFFFRDGSMRLVVT